MSEVKNNFWVYENTEYPTILVFKNKQPDYMMNGYTEHKVISVDKDLDSYIYFIQHQSDMIKKDNEKLKAQLGKAEATLKFYADKMNYSIDHYHEISGDMRRRIILYGDQEEFNELSSAAGRRAREYFKEKGKV